MPELVCELIISLDGFARGERSPAYFGYFGADLDDWIKTNSAAPHRLLMGRRTYEALAGVPMEVRDHGWYAMTRTPGWLFTRTLTAVDWPGLTVVHEDLADFVHALKGMKGSELRTLGSLSVVRQLLAAGLVDRLKLLTCPLVLAQSGLEPVFQGIPDLGLDLVASRTLDRRVILLEYRVAGTPPRSN